MGSTRLPGKVLADIGGQPMLWRVLERTRAAREIHEIIVATSTQPADDEIAAFCSAHRCPCFRGSEMDVLDRYYQAALEYGADAIVRITSDCPLIDPEIIDQTVCAFLKQQPDYASNALELTYPLGLDTEVIARSALDRAWRVAAATYQRVHVTPYIYENPGDFNILSVTGEIDYGGYRWTVDTPEDLEFVRAVYAHMKGDLFTWRDVIALLEQNPELVEINRAIVQKAVREA